MKTDPLARLIDAAYERFALLSDEPFFDALGTAMLWIEGGIVLVMTGLVLIGTAR